LDMEFEPDGSFVITVDDTPANGRKNHIQTRPGADFIMVRDAFGDWLNQSANALTVQRLDPDGAPRRFDTMARHCARIATAGVYYSFSVTQTGKGTAPNTTRPPMSSGAFGGMASQWGSKANLSLEEDEALIIRCNAAGAGFRNVVLTDAYHLSIDYWRRASSLNMVQMAPDENGDFTFVVCARDPGIHNWLDTGGLKRVMFGHRWQAFERGISHDQPWMTGKLVKFDALDKELADGVRRLGDAGRKAQLAARGEGIKRRFAEG